ncbi:MAG: CRTAC1 family protein [Myxococcota bacterium]
MRLLLGTLGLLLIGGCDDDAADSADPICAAACEMGSVCAADGLCHCGDAAGPVCAGEEVCVPGPDAARGFVCEAPGPELPPAVCNAGSRYVPGSAWFREATEAWRLTGVVGVRLNALDFDGDGLTDLMVRRGAGAPDDFSPDGARRTWLLRNNGTGFDDITEASGILALRGPGEADGRPVEVAAFGDVDNDGHVDAYLAVNTTDIDRSIGERSEILLGDGAGGFVLAPQSAASSPGFNDVPAGASFIDYDRDGNLDLFVPQHNFSNGGRQVFMQDRFYRGLGDGTFEEVTEVVGLRTEPWESLMNLNAGLSHSRAWASAACDLNNDGHADLLAPSYGRAPNHLWQADGLGGFVNRSVASGYAFDEDLSWTDNQFARCFCAANRAAEECGGVPAPDLGCMDNWSHDQDREPFRLGGVSAATRCFDVDNDGDLDLLTGEIRHSWAGAGADGGELLVNTGESNVRFERPGDAATGLEVDHLDEANWDEGHMTNAVFDFDNDGWPDIYIGASDYAGNRGQLFHQDNPLSFRVLPVEDFFEHNRSHGVVTADFDRDGDLDMVVGHSRARCNANAPHDCYETSQVRFFENLGADGNFLQLRLVGGAGSNRSAIGARVTVQAGGVTQTQEVDGGYGHYGSSADPVLHFGLGTACEAEVTVRWPDRDLTTETIALPAGHRFQLTQGGDVIPN